MGFLPVKAKVGGKSGPGLSLKTDMTDIGSKKVNSPKAKLGGKIYKNPGTKRGGTKAQGGKHV